MNPPQPSSAGVAAAEERCTPNPADVQRHHAELLALDGEAEYWSEVAIRLFVALGDVEGAHVNACTTAGCATCAALKRANVSVDAFTAAEASRCTCPVQDHFTVSCPDRQTGGAS